MAARTDDSRGRILAASLDVNRDWVGVEAVRNQEDLHPATDHKKSRQEHVDLVQPGVRALWPSEQNGDGTALENDTYPAGPSDTVPNSNRITWSDSPPRSIGTDTQLPAVVPRRKTGCDVRAPSAATLTATAAATP